MKPILPVSFFIAGAVVFLVLGGVFSWVAWHPAPIVAFGGWAVLYLVGAVFAWDLERNP